MENRVAVLSIIVEDLSMVEKINSLLHEYNEYIVGRMGIPYKQRNVSIICIAMDGPLDRINGLTGALGRIPGVSAKAAFSRA